MEDFVIVRTSDATGDMRVYGPYTLEAAEAAIKARDDHSAYVYYELRHPVELR